MSRGLLGARRPAVVARRMLVAVWHILTDETYDRHGNPEKIAAGIYRAAYKIGISMPAV